MTSITHISFTTGEHRNNLHSLAHEVESTKDIELLFGGKLPDELNYCSAESYQSLLTACLSKIPEAGRQKIDSVIIFSSNFLSEFHIHNDLLGNCLQAAKLTPNRTTNVSGGGCVSSIHAIEHADMLIRLERSQCCLVVGIEYQEGLRRLHDYAVLSDASVAIIVESNHMSAAPLFKIGKIATAVSAESMKLVPSLSAQNLNKQVIQKLAVEPNDISTLCSNNLFHPVKAFKERLLGFKVHQQLTDDEHLNLGHFLSCDPWINLLKASTDKVSGDQFLLLTEAAGHSGGLTCSKI